MQFCKVWMVFHFFHSSYVHVTKEANTKPEKPVQTRFILNTGHHTEMKIETLEFSQGGEGTTLGSDNPLENVMSAVFAYTI